MDKKQAAKLIAEMQKNTTLPRNKKFTKPKKQKADRKRRTM